MDDYTFLFTVTDRFSIDGRGVIVVPGIPWAKGTPTVRKGDPLILRTPLGEVIPTTMRDIEMISYRPGAKILEATPILLPKELHKFDIPIGTEVFLASSAERLAKSEQGIASNR